MQPLSFIWWELAFTVFVFPLNVAVAFGIEYMTDLEFGGALSIVVILLVFLQWLGHRAVETQKPFSLKTQTRAQQEMFHESTEQHEVKEEKNP